MPKRSAAWSRPARPSDKKSLVHTMRFRRAAQAGAGEQPVDPATKKRAGTIVSHRRRAGHAAASSRPELAGVPLPRAIVPGGRTAREPSERRLRGSLRLCSPTTVAIRRCATSSPRTPPRIAGRVAGGRIQTTDIAAQRALTADSIGATSSSKDRQAPARRGPGARLITDSSGAAGELA